jgi:hypothetical protein
VSCIILYHRVQETLSIRDTINKAQKLTNLEEKAIIRQILDLDSRAFLSRRTAIEDIVNKLLAKRDSGRVEKN